MAPKYSAYIVIELKSKKEEMELMKMLVGRSASVFTRTDDILQYAQDKMILSINNSNMLNESPNCSTDNYDDSAGMTQSARVLVKREIPFEDDPILSKMPHYSEESGLLDDVDELSNNEDEEEEDNDNDDVPMPMSIQPEHQNDLEWLSMKISNTFEQDEQRQAQQQQHDQQQQFQQQQQYEQDVNIMDNDRTTCKMCNQNIKSSAVSYKHRCNHACVHTAILRYHCGVESCCYKTKNYSSLHKHLKTEHQMRGADIQVKEVMTEEEREELRATVDICFPAFAKPPCPI